MSDASVSSLADSLRGRIGDDQLEFRFARSSGPGGQNVNKVNSRAELIFNLSENRTLVDREKQRIRRRLGRRVSAAGLVRVVSMKFRTQRANRRAATQRFYELLASALITQKRRKPTSVPRGTKERRLRDKRVAGERKRLRSRTSIKSDAH